MVSDEDGNDENEDEDENEVAERLIADFSTDEAVMEEEEKEVLAYQVNLPAELEVLQLSIQNKKLHEENTRLQEATEAMKNSHGERMAAMLKGVESLNGQLMKAEKEVETLSKQINDLKTGGETTEQRASIDHDVPPLGVQREFDEYVQIRNKTKEKIQSLQKSLQDITDESTKIMSDMKEKMILRKKVTRILMKFKKRISTTRNGDRGA